MTLQWKRRLGCGSVAIWMVVIFLFSHQDSTSSSRQSGVLVDFVQSLTDTLSEGLLAFLTRKAAHIVAYLVLGILIYHALRMYGLSRRRVIALSIVIAAGYATFDEIHQTFIPGRSGELRDVLIDTVAGSVGVATYALADRAGSRKKQNLSLQSIGKLASIAAAVTYVCAAIAVIGTQIVPAKYLVVGIAITALAVAAIVAVCFARKVSRIMSVVLIILSLVVMGGSLYVASVSRSTSSFLAAIQETEYSYENYSVIAEKSRRINLATATSAAVVQSDPYTSEAMQELKARTPAAERRYSDPTSLIVALEADETDVAVVNDSYGQLLKENHQGFEQNIEVLTTFRVRVKHVTSKPSNTISKPFVVYISGIDTYGDIASVSRSDVNMLAVVNPLTHKVLLVNTPRDYYVQLHGTSGTPDKLTHAGIYGINMSRQTLEDLYGTNIDYYIRVNFTSLTSIVDVLGGVDVYSDYDFKSFHRGYNRLDGVRALEFSRERYSFQDGDRQRGKNQQRVIEAIIARMNNPKHAVNYQAILGSLQGALQTNMEPEVLTRLANSQLNDMQTWQSESISVDGAGTTAPTYSMGARPLYVMVPNQHTVDAAKTKIQAYLGDQ